VLQDHLDQGKGLDDPTPFFVLLLLQNLPQESHDDIIVFHILCRMCNRLQRGVGHSPVLSGCCLFQLSLEGRILLPQVAHAFSHAPDHLDLSRAKDSNV